MGRALAVEFLDGYRIAVTLENGSSFVYDLSPKLTTMRFAPLRNVELFTQGVLTDNDHIRWTDTTILYIHEMLDVMKRT